MDLSSLPLGVFSLSGVAMGAIWLVLTGRLIPRSTYLDMKEDRDRWHTAHDISEQARLQQLEQGSELLENSRTQVAFIQSLPRPGQ